MTALPDRSVAPPPAQPVSQREAEQAEQDGPHDAFYGDDEGDQFARGMQFEVAGANRRHVAEAVVQQLGRAAKPPGCGLTFGNQAACHAMEQRVEDPALRLDVAKRTDVLPQHDVAFPRRAELAGHLLANGVAELAHLHLRALRPPTSEYGRIFVGTEADVASQPHAARSILTRLCCCEVAEHRRTVAERPNAGKCDRRGRTALDVA